MATTNLRLGFVQLPFGHGHIPWPCLHFDNMRQLVASLQHQGIHRQHRINLEYLKHVLQQSSKDDGPVCYLFGTRTPGGRRLWFGAAAESYSDHLVRAYDHMGHEPCFVQALNETSPIWAEVWAQQTLRQVLPGPGEHAPMA